MQKKARTRSRIQEGHGVLLTNSVAGLNRAIQVWISPERLWIEDALGVISPRQYHESAGSLSVLPTGG